MPKRLGRPPIAPLTVLLRAKISESDYLAFAAAAKRRGHTVAEFLRLLVTAQIAADDAKR